tara:strand:+ start:2738 stop:3073 length:336 start_codon:yes stop_codon:yes gene_type:complete
MIMNKINKLEMINYLSLILVISYLLFDNIYLVIVGILLAIFSVNILLINNLKIRIDKKIKLLIKGIKNILKKDGKSLNLESDDTQTLSLVEVIEESGFIPSANKEDESKVA